MTKEESDLIITEQNKSKEEILKAVAKVKADYHELCSLKDMRIAELEAQIEKMKCCEMCKHKNLNYSFSSICTVRGYDGTREIENPLTCKCDKWEIKEK